MGNNETQSDIVESNSAEANEEIINVQERSTSDESNEESTDLPSVEEFAIEPITKEKHIDSSEVKNYAVLKAPMSQGKRKTNSKNAKSRKVPKLVIKPIKKDEVAPPQENVHEICSLLLCELVNTCVTKVDGEMEELKMPPIIVKIPKASISPKKMSKKDNVKSPQKCIKKLNFTFSKQPSVTIKNL